MTPLVSLTLQPSIVVIPATITSTDKAAVEKAAVEKAAVEKVAAEEKGISQFPSPTRDRSQPRFC